jgi:hypothetical protein
MLTPSSANATSSSGWPALATRGRTDKAEKHRERERERERERRNWSERISDNCWVLEGGEGRGEVAAMQLGRGEYTSIPSLTFRFYNHKNIVFVACQDENRGVQLRLMFWMTGNLKRVLCMWDLMFFGATVNTALRRTTPCKNLYMLSTFQKNLLLSW